MTHSRRLKAFVIDPEGVSSILTGVSRPVGIPDGITVERYGTKWETNSAIIICSHPDWPEVDIGKELELQPVLGRLNEP